VLLAETIGATRRLLNFLWRESGAGKPGFGGFLPHRQLGNDHTNVRNERRDAAGEACRGTSARWRGWASEPPTHLALICHVLRSEERRQHLLFGFDLEAIDVQYENGNKQERHRIEQEDGPSQER